VETPLVKFAFGRLITTKEENIKIKLRELYFEDQR
jgi:hypothetical protein